MKTGGGRWRACVSSAHLFLWCVSFLGYWLKTPFSAKPLRSKTWRDTQREHFPMTTANTWRREEHKTLFSGWKTQKGTGEYRCSLKTTDLACIFLLYGCDFRDHVTFSSLSLVDRRRHADGTYTSDVSSYLQDQAAKEFVSWLKTGRGRRDWRRPSVAISKNNSAILIDSVPLCSADLY